MSADWDFSFTADLDRDQVALMLQAFGELGFPVFTNESGIPVTSGDGLRSFELPSVEGLVDLWIAEGGAVDCQSPDHYVTLARGTDSSGFMIGVRRYQLEHEGREVAWSSFRRLIDVTLELLPVEYLVGWEEDMVENLLMLGLLDIERSGAQVDGRIAAGRLPLVLGWLNVAPADSSLGRQLGEVADMLGMAVAVNGRYVELQLSPEPWGDALQAVFDANRTWRGGE